MRSPGAALRERIRRQRDLTVERVGEDVRYEPRQPPQLLQRYRRVGAVSRRRGERALLRVESLAQQRQRGVGRGARDRGDEGESLV